jgi:hypothetical protein
MAYPWIIVMLAFGFILNRAVGNYERVLRSWRGQTEQRLVVMWGEPHSIDETRDGKEVYIYSKSEKIAREVYIYAERDKTAKARAIARARAGVRTGVRRCVTRFVIDDNNIIVKSSYEGDSCLGFYGDKVLPR